MIEKLTLILLSSKSYMILWEEKTEEMKEQKGDWKSSQNSGEII